jgi:hypothetical protein
VICAILEYNNYKSLLFTCHEQTLLRHKQPKILYLKAFYSLRLQVSLSIQGSFLFPVKKITNKYSDKGVGYDEINNTATGTAF